MNTPNNIGENLVQRVFNLLNEDINQINRGYMANFNDLLSEVLAPPAGVKNATDILKASQRAKKIRDTGAHFVGLRHLPISKVPPLPSKLIKHESEKSVGSGTTKAAKWADFATRLATPDKAKLAGGAALAGAAIGAGLLHSVQNKRKDYLMGYEHGSSDTPTDLRNARKHYLIGYRHGLAHNRASTQESVVFPPMSRPFRGPQRKNIREINVDEKIGHIKAGALHKDLGISQDKKIGRARLLKAKNSSDPKIRKRANFALNMNKNESITEINAKTLVKKFNNLKFGAVGRKPVSTLNIPRNLNKSQWKDIMHYTRLKKRMGENKFNRFLQEYTLMAPISSLIYYNRFLGEVQVGKAAHIVKRFYQGGAMKVPFAGAGALAGAGAGAIRAGLLNRRQKKAGEAPTHSVLGNAAAGAGVGAGVGLTAAGGLGHGLRDMSKQMKKAPIGKYIRNVRAVAKNTGRRVGRHIGRQGGLL
jgi:hypothetical protein